VPSFDISQIASPSEQPLQPTSHTGKPMFV
jgi:hypothetical protein